ncbi:32710_t:CDS:2, partial [Racocetra persica]
MKPWNKVETAHLLTLYQCHGRDWRTISEKLKRTQKECRDKYHELIPGFRRQPPRN